MDKDPFKEYMKQSEPNKRDKGYAWHTAIGLQAVDGLKTSKYLIDTAIKNIEGDISIDEAQELLNTYYEENPKADIEDRTEEADKVAVRIAKILSEKAFSFTPNEYISIHKKLFTGIYGHAGKLRDYNITKKEWVLNGATILYGSASELRATLDYDFAEEKKFSYKNLSMEEIIHHLAFFVSRLWQIHVFGEGNTRTTAVFFIKYLRTLGFDVTNDIFAENAWYFRNALVRANYNDLKNHIDSFELLFLDIEMPNISGIDIAQSLSYKHLDIIFISSHDEMIKKCFNRNVVGFVEKSHLEEIDDIICRIIKKEHLTIIKDGKEFDIYFNQIAYIEYSLRDTTIYLNNNSKIKLSEKSLSFLSKELDERFYQINRNIIINLDMEPIYNKGTVKISHNEFQVSRRNQKDLKIKMLERSIYNARNI